jgi:uncharacterized membrane protein
MPLNTGLHDQYINHAAAAGDLCTYPARPVNRPPLLLLHSLIRCPFVDSFPPPFVDNRSSNRPATPPPRSKAKTREQRRAVGQAGRGIDFGRAPPRKAKLISRWVWTIIHPISLVRDHEILRVGSMSKNASRRPSTPQGKENPSADDHLGLERLIFFSDAVFAIAITLLALDIRLPAGIGELSNAQLLHQLLGAWHKYLAFAISFLAIGSFWAAHHRKFRFIKRYDRGLLILNLLFLMVIAFVPFPTSVLSESGNLTATIFYALTMTAAGLMLTVVWWYASRHNHLTDSHLDARQRRRQFVGLALTVGLFALSIGLAFLNKDLAKFLWLLIVPISRYGQRG